MLVALETGVGETRDVAFGLYWKGFDARAEEPDKSRARRLKGFISKEGKALRALAVTESSDGAMLGFMTAGSLPKKVKFPKNAISAANALAGAFGVSDSARIFVTELPGKMVSLILTQNGRPVSGYDLVYPRDGIEAHIMRIVAELGFSEEAHFSDIEIYSATENILMETTGLPSPHAFTWDVVLSGFNGPVLVKYSPPISPIWIVVVFAILAAGWYGYQWHKKREAARLAASQQQQIDPNILYQQQLALELPKVRPISKVQMEGVMKTMTSFPFQVAGWKLENKIVCETASAQCFANYLRNGGSYQAFEELGRKQFAKVTYDPGGGKILAVLDLPKASGKESLNPKSLPPESSIFMSWWTAFQGIKDSGSDGKFTTPAPWAVPPGVDPAPLKDLIKSGAWSIQSPGVIGEHFVPIESYVTLDRVTLELNVVESKINFEGKYYVSIK